MTTTFSLLSLNPFALAIAFSLLTPLVVHAVDLLPTGHRPLPPGVHALVGGKIVVKPGVVLDPGTVVIRDGLIAAVGANAAAPADARVWDMKGLTIYAGLIDAALTLGTNTPVVSTTLVEPISSPTSGINFFGVPGQEKDPGQVGPGYELPRITPEIRAAQTYAPHAKALETLRELGFTAGNVTPGRGILRGTSAFVVLSDENPNTTILKPDVFHHVAFDAGGARGGDGAPREQTPYPGSLMGVIAAVRQCFFDAQQYQIDHADYAKKPAGRKRPPFNPSLEALAPALDRRMPVVFEPGSAVMVDRAARVAEELGVRPILLASGQEWRRPDLAKATGLPFIVPVNIPSLPRLPEDDDWTAVSLDRLRAWDWAAENPALLEQEGLEIALTTHGLSDKKAFRKNLRQALDRGLSEDDALAALTLVPARLCGLDTQLGTIEAGKLANLTVVEGASYFDPETRVREVWIDGRIYPSPPAAPRPTRTGESPRPPELAKANDERPDTGTPRKQNELRELQKKRLARAPSEGRGVLAAPRAVLITGATIWTCGPQGRLENADLLIVDGKIKRVGGTRSPDEAGQPGDSILEIIGRGLHITPGLIDCHSHSMILGGVNESTVPSSAMVRIADVVNSETDNIHQQLAGGLTCANLLHGSANPIGGQNQVIKLREGASPEELKFTGAPPGIKFALGENVKQSSRDERSATRFPQTRMGVPAFMANRFAAARLYLKEWENFRTNGGVPPRRDLELEAIGEIIEGRRLIHCHSYRQDEIVAFLRTMESFGVRVATLQHVLEGYKVADEIARHGAGGSCFSDWWAYKFEVYDAIPYGGSLMRERGVVVSFNSDSSDYARRLYLEAAKAVKYGGTPEEEALKFVTLNPAKQLRLEARVGSLEPGKDGDFAIWSRSPLDSATVCLETWIDGKKYFDRKAALERAAALEKERNELLVKAKKLASSGGEPRGGGEETEAGVWAAFFRDALEHEQSWDVVDCQDCKTTGRRE